MIAIIISLGLALICVGTILISSTLFPTSIKAYNISCFSAVIFSLSALVFIISSTLKLFPLVANLLSK